MELFLSVFKAFNDAFQSPLAGLTLAMIVLLGMCVTLMGLIIYRLQKARIDKLEAAIEESSRDCEKKLDQMEAETKRCLRLNRAYASVMGKYREILIQHKLMRPGEGAMEWQTIHDLTD